MDEVLGKRILGACVLVLLALVLSSLLPQPHALPPTVADKRVVYDLRQLKAAPPAVPPVSVAPDVPAPSPKPAPPVAEAPKQPAKNPPKQPPAQEPSPSAAMTPSEAPTVQPPTPVPPAASTPAKVTPIEFSWYIQIGAFAHEGNAQLSMKRLRDAGLHPRTDVLGAGATKRYRVRCGPYPSRKQALQQQARVAKLGFADARVTGDAR